GKVAFLVDPQQNLLISDRTLGWSPPPDLAPLFVHGATVGRYTGGSGEQMIGARSPVAPVNATSWSVIVEQPTSTLMVEVYRSLLLLAGLVALVGILALAWAFYQARRLLLPIQALSSGADALAEGNLKHRIEVTTQDELGQLATTFNVMAERLQRSKRKIEEQNERLRSGLALARDIQQGLLPAVPPWRTELLSIYGRSLPANEVGGDFYSYMALPDGRAAVAIGDISGKGVAAALLMALTSSTLESQAHFLEHPSAMLMALHEALRPRLQANHMNAAIMVAVFNADARSVTIANAGMIAPLLARRAPADGIGCSFVEVGGLPIGTPLGAHYQEVTVALNPGDTLILLSDGIVEAHNGEDQIFGFERLEALVAALPPDLTVVELVEQIIRTVIEFTGNAEPHDDITIIATRPVARMGLALLPEVQAGAEAMR
ncbi:MAG: HAMP domain-containing protein, partial [Candidatus Viridilinea halotolerans]